MKTHTPPPGPLAFLLNDRMDAAVTCTTPIIQIAKRAQHLLQCLQRVSNTLAFALEEYALHLAFTIEICDWSWGFVYTTARTLPPVS